MRLEEKINKMHEGINYLYKNGYEESAELLVKVVDSYKRTRLNTSVWMNNNREHINSYQKAYYEKTKKTKGEN